MSTFLKNVQKLEANTVLMTVLIGIGAWMANTTYENSTSIAKMQGQMTFIEGVIETAAPHWGVDPKLFQASNSGYLSQASTTYETNN